MLRSDMLERLAKQHHDNIAYSRGAQRALEMKNEILCRRRASKLRGTDEDVEVCPECGADLNKGCGAKCVSLTSGFRWIDKFAERVLSKRKGAKDAKANNNRRIRVRRVVRRSKKQSA